MNPTPTDVYVSQPLTTFSVGYTLDQLETVADKIFPVVPVEVQAGTYWQYSLADWRRVEAQPRAPGTESQGGGFRLSTATYSAAVYAFHKDIDGQTRANYQVPGAGADQDASRYVMDNLVLKREALWATSYFGTGIWTTQITGVSGAPSGGQVKQWDASGSTPIEDIAAQMDVMEQLAGGYRPNVLVLGPQVYTKLLNNAELIARIQYTRPGGAFVTRELLASAFGVDRVVVPRAVQNTAAEAQTASYAYLFDKSALLAYANPQPGIMRPSAGYTFSWRGYLGMGNSLGIRMKKIPLLHLDVDRVEGEMAFGFGVVNADMGVFFSSLVA